jgi:cobalt-zinc-cadmium efflux system membrane fusion protein
MRLAIVGAALLSLAACNRGEPVKAEGKQEQTAREPAAQEVVVSEQGQRSAGLVLHTVQTESVSETISATGQLTVNEDQTWSAGSLHEGRIVTVSAKPGDVVRQGQVLARMHSHEVHESRAQYKTAQLELERLQAAEAHSRRLRDRAKRLVDLKAMSQQELESAEAGLRNAEAAVKTARTELDRHSIHITEYLDVPLDESREGKDHLIPIKAPAAGIIIERKANAGTVLTAGQEVFRITDPSTIWMTANVNEADLAHLRTGQTVKVLVRAYPNRTFAGRILRLGEGLDPTTRTLRVRVAVPNPGGMLKPEMYASAEIQRAAGRSTLLVPDAAIQDIGGNRVVFVKTGPDQFQVRPVEVGGAADQRIEITSGLQPGEQVVAKGSFILKSQMLQSAIE